jgi:hypothetical protein
VVGTRVGNKVKLDDQYTSVEQINQAYGRAAVKKAATKFKWTLKEKSATKFVAIKRSY